MRHPSFGRCSITSTSLGRAAGFLWLVPLIGVWILPTDLRNLVLRQANYLCRLSPTFTAESV